jgi:hypothetical protein
MLKNDFIAIYPSRGIAGEHKTSDYVKNDSPFNLLDSYETVRILNEQEEKEFAWEWCKRIYKATRTSDIPYDETSELYLKSIFEKEWKEQGK